MTITLVNSDQVGFADGNTGHVYTLPSGSPAVDDWDVLWVNSDTTVTTPSGWAASPTRVVSQGAYVYSRKAAGGEGSTVTITTVGNFPSHLVWARISGADIIEVANAGGVDATFTNVTPAYTSPALSTASSIALAFAAVHNFTGTAPTGAVWSSGYTAIQEGSNGTGATGVYGAVAYKYPAGPGTESPSASWTNNARNRYVLFLSLTPAAGGPIDGAAALAGTGAVTAAATVTVSGTAALAGAGSTTAAASARVSGAAALSGTGALTASPGSTSAGSAALAGAGSLTATGLSVRPGTAALGGAGALTAAATVRIPGAAALAGAGSTTAAGSLLVHGSAALTAIGALTANVSGRVVHRPNTGITARPDEGLVTRPFTGTVTRP